MNVLFTEEELTKYAERFLKDNFNIDLLIPIKRNNRLRTSLGRYVMDNASNPIRIELSGKLLTYGKESTIIGVLKHECIHYAYHVQGKDMRDGHPQFEKALQQFNAPSTESLKVGKFYTFECVGCKKRGETQLKRLAFKPEDYRTHCCQEKLRIVRETIYRG